MVPAGHMHQGSVVAIPQGMMPFAMQEPPQQMSTIMHPSTYPLVTASQQTMSPHTTNSPPPTYSPSHPQSSPRNYPGSPPYSQASHISHQQQMMMDELTGSPMRKSPPETHYLSHHHYERSPSHSPMGHFPVRTHSPPQPTIYPHSGGSPSMVNHSPMGPL